MQICKFSKFCKAFKYFIKPLLITTSTTIVHSFGHKLSTGSQL